MYFNTTVGSTYNTQPTTAWTSYNSSNWAGGHTAYCFASSNDSWQITGVQLEVGKVATPFEHRSYGEELAACQRYYQYVERARGSGNRDAGNNTCAFSHRIPEMRASPTMARVFAGNPYNWNFIQFSNVNKSHFSVLIEIITTDAYWYYNDGYTADAEL